MNRTSEITDALKETAEPILNGNTTRDVILVSLVILLLAVGLFCWAAFVRKRPRDGRHNAWAAVVKSSSGRKKRRKRRSHHKNRQMNPTRAETGGLPQAHPEDRQNSPPRNLDPEI